MATVVRNAIAYVTRRRYRTMIIFSILTLVLACIHVCLNIIISSDSMEKSLYKASNSSLSIVRKGDQGAFEVKNFADLKRVKEVSEVIPKYEGVAALEGSSVILGNQSVKRDDVPSELRNSVSAKSTTSTEREVLFSSGVFSLDEGRHIGSKDRGKVLVHRKFAEKNKLKLHDKITMRFLNSGEMGEIGELSGESGAQSAMEGKGLSGEAETFEIVGIYSGKMQEQHSGLPSDLSENTIFTDYESSQKSLGYAEGSHVASTVTVTADSPEKLESVSKNIRKLNIDWSKFEISKNNAAFHAASKSLAGVKSIMRIMTLAILGCGTIVLSLILILWLRERIYEIGILLSIGVSKLAIVGQFIVELVLVSIPAMISALIVGQISFSFIVDGFVASGESEALSGLLSRGGMYTSFISFGMSYILLLMIIIGSVVITSGAILIRRPREILSKIS